MRAGSTLRQRTLTAFVLGPLAMAAILLFDTPAFGLFVALFILAGAWEWGPLAGVTASGVRAGFVAAVAAVLALLWAVPELRVWLTGAAVLWWAWQAVALARVKVVAPALAPEPALFAVGLLVLTAPWGALVALHGAGERGPLLVLLFALLVWTADSLAYFAGRRFGRAKLAPRLSPGKTRVGVYAALAGALIWGGVLGILSAHGPAGIALSALVCVLTVAVSVVGDLYESLLKRRRGLKDSSRLLPGHGGMLDRVDSLTAAAPVFALGLITIGGFV